MQPSLGLRLSAACASLTILLLLGACGSRTELKVSADTYCEKARYIAATDEQLRVMGVDVGPPPVIVAPDTWAVMRPYAQQVAANNVMYNANCLEYTKGDAQP